MKNEIQKSPLTASMQHYCDTLWEYDKDTQQLVIYIDKMTPQLCNQSHNYRDIESLYLSNYVHEVDIPIWKENLSIEKLEDFLNSDKTEHHFYIRVFNDKHEMEWHDVFFDKVQNNKILITSRNIDSFHRNAAISKAVEREYDYVVYIDIAKNSYVMYNSPALSKTPLPPLVGSDYEKILYEYNKQYVIEEEVEQLTENMKISHVIQQLKKAPEYILYATIVENEKHAHKKLRFSYSDDNQDILLLSRIDITDIIHEHELREEAEQKQKEYQEKIIKYMENMPIAYCTTKILVDENNKPYDFEFTYSNREHAKLEGTEYGELIGKTFYTFFENSDKKWLNYYADTAFNGTTHILKDYSPEIDKHLLIYTYQPEYGFCGCVVQDITQNRLLEIELAKSKERISLLLTSSLDTIFQYDSESKTLFSFSEDVIIHNTLPIIHNIPYGLVEKGLLDESYLDVFAKAIDELEAGKNEASFDIRARLNIQEDFHWYNLKFFTYHEIYTEKRRVLGYLRNIDEIVTQQELLKNEAELDPLTGILNVKAGKKAIENLIQHHDISYSAMFLMDLDDFKGINDNLGHQMGDHILKKFTSILKHVFRSNDIIYRLGGDEFVVFAHQISEPTVAIDKIMERFFHEISKANQEGFKIGSSVGIFVTNKIHNFDEYYHNADKALYETKKKGKNHYTVIVDEDRI